MAIVLDNARRSGTVQRVITPAAGQTWGRIGIVPDLSRVVPAASFELRVEVSDDGGATWFTLAGSSTPNLQAALATPLKFGGTPTVLDLRWSEQIYRSDVLAQRLAATGYRKLATDSRGRDYWQLAMPLLRVTVTLGDQTWFALDLTTEDRLAASPLPHNSASLLGTFAGTESPTSGDTTVTSGSRTTTAGSLVVGFGACWRTPANTNLTISDNQSNSFTEQHDLVFSTEARLVLSYNMGGTRAAGHTITNTAALGSGLTVGGAEFDGIASSPTVVSATGTGNGTSASSTVNPSVPSLVLLMAGYDASSPTTLTPTWTQVVEVDENNDRQSFNVSYNVALSGSQSPTCGIGATSDWGAIAVAFSESDPGPSLASLEGGMMW